jgi:abortive infection bacteriophage resistance protein
MQFTKPPLSIPDQLVLLQSRGLLIPNPTKASKYLSPISYYRLSAYSLSFQDVNSGSHQFLPDVTFDDILNLYLFDRELRLLIFDAIERTEVSFRTQLVNQFSITYHAHWFEDAALFSISKNHADDLQILDKELKRSKEDFVNHYKDKYSKPDRPPSWISLEVASMGLLSRFYRNLKMCKAKKDIAAIYGLPTPYILESWMQSMSYVRNICAHHGRLWNRTLVTKPTLPQNTARPWLTDLELPPAKLYAFLCCLLYLRKAVNPKTAFAQRIVRLLEKYPNINTKRMGFPPQWKEEMIWQ